MAATLDSANDVCAACLMVRTPDCQRAHCELSRNVVLTPWFGNVKIESRTRSEGNRLVYESRALHYTIDGVLEKDTGWSPTGAVIVLPEPEPCRRWWEFWK